jgi:DNA polymerase-3 subunit beta
MKVFKNIINQTSFAASTQESRPLLTGINFKVENDQLECIATDSYRLAKKEIKLNEKLSETISVVIPSRNVNELIKIIGEDEDDIEINLFSNKVIFKFDNIIFKTKLLSGTYPDTSKLIPSDFLVTIELDTTEFYNVIDRASLLNSDRDKNIINLELTGDEMLITSISQEIGKVEERMIIKKDSKEDIKISFSARFMLEAIKALQCETMEIRLNGDIKPIILKEKDGDNMTQLILPIKTH